jgi:hypothetical protein
VAQDLTAQTRFKGRKIEGGLERIRARNRETCGGIDNNFPFENKLLCIAQGHLRNRACLELSIGDRKDYSYEVART